MSDATRARGPRGQRRDVRPHRGSVRPAQPDHLPRHRPALAAAYRALLGLARAVGAPCSTSPRAPADLAILTARRTRPSRSSASTPRATCSPWARPSWPARASRRACRCGTARRVAPLEDASLDGRHHGLRHPQRGRPPRGAARNGARHPPGGRIAILELSEPNPGPLAMMARFHIHTVVPWVGGLLSGSRSTATCRSSSRPFRPRRFRRHDARGRPRRAGGAPLTFGVVHLYVATPAAKP
jgi:demethylmenaquinone methyltransferase/2-methoxy-6-polyprenyl-1,4-benzoquinol methylase